MSPHHHHHHHHNQPMTANLKSLRTRFALRFIRSLKKINQTLTSTRHHQRLVKIAADASMASAVGPRRAWSRAILRRCRLRHARAGRRGRGRARELRRLVPGGEAMDMQTLLDETAHYIHCLSTQVRVMRCILNYCSTNTPTTR